MPFETMGGNDEEDMLAKSYGRTLVIGGWLWALVTGYVLQHWIIPNTLWHAGDGLLAGGDWVTFQQQALQLADKIQATGWAAWELRYEGQAPASLLAATYVLTGIFSPWVLLPISGLLYAVAIWAAASIARRLGLRGWPFILALAPFVFPSSMLIYGQPHKDILSLPGILLVAWAWVFALDEGGAKLSRRFHMAMAASSGLLLIWWGRPYQAQLMIAVSLLIWAVVAVGVWMRKRLPLAGGTVILVVLIVTYVGAEKLAAPAAPAAPLCETWKPEISIPVLARPVGTLICYRHGFIQYHAGAEANIDHDRPLTNYVEVLAYLPRALQIGLLSPFPIHWWSDASSPGGHIRRLMSGVEMLYVYAVLAGLLWVLRRSSSWAQVSAMLLIGLIGVLFYAYSSPNVGALYRYRFPFLVLLLMVGMMGWNEKLFAQPERVR
ncbi:MAG: hypothetical protein N2Z69_00095 [Methylophilaceae bacterium]|nr:hypothetical protein [Methylophilaceae bacterium]